MKTTAYLMENFLDSTISCDEKMILNERIIRDNTLAKELAFRKELNQLDQENDINMLRSKLDLARHTAQESEKYIFSISKSNRYKRLVFAAATVSGIAIGGLAMLTGQQEVKHESLYRKSFKPYPPIGIYREVQENEHESLLFKTMRQYQDENYWQAVEGFESLLTQNPSSVIIKFYLAVSYMHLNEYKKSRDFFDEVIQANYIYIEQAIWYKGLTYLAEGNVEDAISMLTLIDESKSSIGIKASHLLRKLEAR
jgi:tetratricopeptide (TPR) repeat protein